jgi:hypothetical protein
MMRQYPSASLVARTLPHCKQSINEFGAAGHWKPDFCSEIPGFNFHSFPISSHLDNNHAFMDLSTNEEIKLEREHMSNG